MRDGKDTARDASGEGVWPIAVFEGFSKENLLTEESRKAWEKWKANNPRTAKIPVDSENHDTIGMVAIDNKGNLSACITDQRLA